MPLGWKLTGEGGRRAGAGLLEVTGDGKGTSEWRHPYRFNPGGLYRFEMHARRLGGGTSGCAISGPDFANVDRGLSDTWDWYGHVFRALDNAGTGFVRVGQWMAEGSLQFDAVRVVPVMPVFKMVGRLRLGEGEVIRAGRYAFAGNFNHETSNYYRPLLRANAGFNSERWCFGGGNEVVYVFHVPGHSFRSGKVQFNVNYHVQGGCVAEISRDGNAWRRAASRDIVGAASANVPAEWLPAETIYLRLRSNADNCSFQVNNVEFAADLAGTPPDVVGRTDFAEVARTSPDLAVEEVCCDDSSEAWRPVIHLTARNRGSTTMEATFVASSANAASAADPHGLSATLAPGGRHTFVTAVPLDGTGTHPIRLALRNGKKDAVTATLPWNVPEYYRSDFGQRIEGAGGPADVWWCEAAWKIALERPAPRAASPAATLAAGRELRTEGILV